MQQFQQPIVLKSQQEPDYSDNFHLYSAMTGEIPEVKPPVEPQKWQPSRQPENGSRNASWYPMPEEPHFPHASGYLPLDDPSPAINIPKCIAIVVISLFTLYTFAIICVELFKIFAQIVAEK